MCDVGKDDDDDNYDDDGDDNNDNLCPGASVSWSAPAPDISGS